MDPPAPPTIVLPTPPPPPAPPPPPPPVVRAPHLQAPVLDAGCVLPVETDTPSTCGWDDGFPAISKDGRTVAVKYAQDPGPRGGSSLTIRFIDTTTSRVTRDIELLSIDESWAGMETDKTKANAALDKLQAEIPARVAKAQRLLDAGQFRTLTPLGTSNEPLADLDKVHADIVGNAARVVDPATGAVLWQGHFGAASHRVAHSEDEMCGGWSLSHLGLWWDPATRTVLGRMTYRTGGCMCTDEFLDQVQRPAT
jgi:hypothetical protein